VPQADRQACAGRDCSAAPVKCVRGPTYGTIRRYGVGPQTYAQGLGSRPTRLDVCRRLGDRGRMNELLVGYARVSTEQQDLTAQRNGLHALGVGDDPIYVDHGLTGTTRPTRATAGAGRLPSWRHLNGDQAGPACPVAA
jgi:Resolvase, N terminal domain